MSTPGYESNVPMPQSPSAPYQQGGMPMPAYAQPYGQAQQPIGNMAQAMQPTGQLPVNPQATGQMPQPAEHLPGYLRQPGYAPAQPSAFMLGLKAFLPSYTNTWRSKLDSAFNLVLPLKLYWLVQYLAYSLAFSLFFSFYMGRMQASGMNLVGGFAGSLGYGGYSNQYMAYFGPNWAQYFFSMFFTIFAALVLRALTLKLIAATRHVQMPFSVAANIYGLATVSLTFAAAGAWVLILLPSGAVVAVVSTLAVLAFLACQMIAEIVTWNGMNYAARYNKGILIPYVWLTIAWLLAAVLTYILFNLIFGANMLSSIAGGF